METKLFKQISYWLGVIVVGIALGITLQFVRAWTEPASNPPGGNLGAPINTGQSAQTKFGELFVNGKLWRTGQQLVQNIGLWVGGKAQADDFCLNGDITKCLSNSGGASQPVTGGLYGSCAETWGEFGTNGYYDLTKRGNCYSFSSNNDRIIKYPATCDVDRYRQTGQCRCPSGYTLIETGTHFTIGNVVCTGFDPGNCSYDVGGTIFYSCYKN